MRDLRLFVSDLVFKDGDLDMVTEGEESAQNFTIRIKTRRGEWHQNVLVGYPLFELFSQSTSMAHKEAIIRSVIYSTPGVREILFMNVFKNQTEMRLEIEVHVMTDWGQEELNVAI